MTEIICPLCQKVNHCSMARSAAAKKVREKSAITKDVMAKNLAPGKNERKQQAPCWCVGITIPQGLLALVPDNAKDKHCICMACIEAFNLKTQVTTATH